MTPLATAIFTKLGADSTLVGMLGLWQGQPRIFTQRPVPPNVGRPIILTATTVSAGDEDFVASQMRVISRDIGIYGNAPQQDTVDDIAERVRLLLHRQPLIVTGFNTVAVTASGPIDGPVDLANEVAKIVTVTARLQPTS